MTPRSSKDVCRKEHRWSKELFKSLNQQILINKKLVKERAYLPLSVRPLRRAQQEQKNCVIVYSQCLSCPTIKIVTPILNSLL